MIRIVLVEDLDLIREGIRVLVSQIDDFEKEQQVKIWYSIDNNNNRAIKIKKLMDLGC